MNIDEIIHWLKEMQGPAMSEAELYCAGSCYGTGEMAYSSPEDYALYEAINALEQLKEYRKLEEQDRLIKLPCKVGDTVYVNGVLGYGEAEKYKVIRVDYHSTLGTGRNEFYIEALLDGKPDNSIGFYDKNFGKTVFLTQSEAEAKLKELRGGENE